MKKLRWYRRLFHRDFHNTNYGNPSIARVCNGILTSGFRLNPSANLCPYCNIDMSVLHRKDIAVLRKAIALLLFSVRIFFL